MSNSHRRQLVAVLEEYGVSVAGFDGLRSDAYEKHLASRSLKELERFYEVLLGSARGYEEIISECPRWESGKRAGELPHRTTLQDIKDRIRSDHSVREKVGAQGFMKVRKNSGEPTEGAEYFNTATEVLGEEILVAKMAGKPVLENLKGFDRLLRMGSLQLRKQRETRSDARFEWERFGKEIEVKPKPPKPGWEPVRLSEAEREILESIRTMCLLQRVYGEGPEEYRQQDLQEMVDRVKESVAEDPAKALVVEGAGRKGKLPKAKIGHRGTETSVTLDQIKTPEANVQGPKANTNDEARMTKPASGGDQVKAEAKKEQGVEGRETKVEGKANNGLGGAEEVKATETKTGPEETVEAREERLRWEERQSRIRERGHGEQHFYPWGWGEK